MANEFKEVDRGWDGFTEAFRDAEDAHITLGVHQEDNATQEDGDISLAKLMEVHEFGTVIDHPGGTPYTIINGDFVPLPEGHDAAIGRTDPHKITIPPRPALREGIKQNEDELAETSSQALEGAVTGQLSLERALNLIGQDALRFVTSVFGDTSVLQPNAESTIDQKGSAAPLEDDGQLRASIDYQTHDTN